MTLIEGIAGWVHRLTLKEIPPSTQERIRLQIATAISAAAWTPWHEPSQRVHDAFEGSVGSAMVFATGARMAPADAAFVNAAFAMAFDCDDYMLTGHTGHSAVQVPLAFGERLDDVVVAAAAANEVVGRVSTACLLGPLNGQMSSYIHNLGAAIALSKLEGLSAEGIADAIGLALYQPNHCLVPGFWHEPSKTLTASQPLAQGITAVRLARAGLEGPRDLFDHPLGFFHVFSFVDATGLFDGLGQTWFSDTLSYKRYPGTSYISAGVEGALAAVEGTGWAASEISSVRIDTTVLSATLDDLGAAGLTRGPLDANAINFSLRLSVAAALVLGDLTPDHLRPETVAEAEPAIRALAERIDVVHDLSQTARTLSASPVGARLLANLGVDPVRKITRHLRELRQGSARRSAVEIGDRGSAWAGLREILRSRGERVSDLDFDASSFRMLQSATVRVTAHGEERRREVEVPIGACGRDHGEARELVRWRCQRAFGGPGDAVFDYLTSPSGTVEGLYECTDPSR